MKRLKTPRDLSSSQERYLSVILLLESEKDCAKAGEIADMLQVHRSSVTAALHALAEREMIEYEPYGAVTLSEKGKTAAREILDRCRIIREFLIRALDVDTETAQEAARRMQSSVPVVVIDRMADCSAVASGGKGARSSELYFTGSGQNSAED